MKDSKVLRLLRSLQKEELRWLAKRIRSPYYNSNEWVIKLFEYLRKYGPKYTSRKLEKEKVFAHLFPGKTYNDQRIRLLMFRLTDLIEEFLVAERLKRDHFQKQRLLYSELGERNLYELFDRKKRELIRHLEKDSYKNEYYYLAKWRLEHDHFFHPQTYRYRDSTIHLGEMMGNLDAFFMLAKMRYGAELLNRKNILSENHEVVFLEEVKELVYTHQDFGADIVFQVYADMIGLMKEPENETTYLRLEENVTNHLEKFRPGDQSSLIRYLINTTIQLYKKGKEDYLERQFRLYQLGLERNLFLNEDRLTDGTFLNIIVTASVLGKFNWIEEFIDQFSPKLPEEKRSNAINLGKSYLYFGKGQFRSSANLLNQIESNDLQYLLRIKSLSIRNYFELFLNDESYWELVNHKTEAFEKFLKRNEPLSRGRIQAYLSFIFYLRKITNLKTHLRLTKKNLNDLSIKLEQENSVIAKQWLLEKINSFKR